MIGSPRWLTPLLLLAACAAGPVDDDSTGAALGEAIPGRSIASTALAVDQGRHTASALIRFDPGSDTTARLEFAPGGNVKVLGGNGKVQVTKDALLVEGLPETDGWISVAYDQQIGDVLRADFLGDLYNESTVMWPDRCGELFPCHSNPADASAFTLQVTDVDRPLTAVYPTSLPEVPSYQVAWAIGDYRYLSGGTTEAGTEVGVYTLGEPDDFRRASLTDMLGGLRVGFERMETLYGPYRFGKRVASVEVATYKGSIGGMEHHPFWHVENDYFDDVDIQLHEAAHGWFGDGVRLRCWEDLVLSEGVATYVAMRLSIASGAVAESTAWQLVAQRANKHLNKFVPAWPSGCVDVRGTFYEDGSPHSEVYTRGAQFLREVARVVGIDAVDRALGDFYRARVGTAAGMSDLLDQIEKSAGFDSRPLAEVWLRSDTPPVAVP